MILTEGIIIGFAIGIGSAAGVGFAGAKYIAKHPEIVMKQITRRIMQAAKDKQPTP